jgi:hypothetical protein
VYGAETQIFRKVDQKYVESFEILCWRRMEKIIWTDHVRNVKKCYIKPRGKKHLITIKGGKVNWIGHIL